MTDVADLLKQHGAPLPNAIEMETEIRSEGVVAPQTVNVPDWVTGVRTSSVLAEWRCTLDSKQINALRDMLKTVVGGKSKQQLINEAFDQQGIGSYIGTFIEEGLLVDGGGTIRVLFAYRTDKERNSEAVNRSIHGLLFDQRTDASKALNDLRARWVEGTNKSEGRLVMLSEIDPYTLDRSPYTYFRLQQAGSR